MPMRKLKQLILAQRSKMSGVYSVVFTCLTCLWTSADAARILFVVPTASVSHQIIFRPLSQELARRGYKVVVFTTDPAFKPGQTPANLTEIDLHDVSYKTWTDRVVTAVSTGKTSFYTQIDNIYGANVEIFAKQMRTEEVKKILADKNQKFDLLIAEGYQRSALSLSHIYRCPVIQMNSFGGMDEQYADMGVPINPILYPDFMRSRIYNLSLWEKGVELYNRYHINRLLTSYEAKENDMLQEVFGKDMPPIKELKKNVELLMVNVDPAFEGYRPVPPNVIHLGSLNCAPPKELPQELKTWMDSSKHGIIYMSFGTNTDPSLLPSETVAVFRRVFAKLPYDVLWKWRDPPALPPNVRTAAWLPQSDLLPHKKVLLFITQAGLQSTDEALYAGVPLLAFPILADQWFNAEQYERLGVGRRLSLTGLTDELLQEAIENVINDKSYRIRSKWLGEEMRDRPMSSLERAVWWVERVLRRRGPVLRAPEVNPVDWLRFIEGDLLVAAVGTLSGLVLVSVGLCMLVTRSAAKVKTT